MLDERGVISEDEERANFRASDTGTSWEEVRARVDSIFSGAKGLSPEQATANAEAGLDYYAQHTQGVDYANYLGLLQSAHEAGVRFDRTKSAEVLRRILEQPEVNKELVRRVAEKAEIKL